MIREAGPPQRVVSLIPSLTETLFDLGAGDAVVGVTDFCIFPPGISAARIGGTKNPHVEAIRALKPDLVHMNLEENLKRHADAIAEFAPVFVTEPKSVDDVASLITTLGAIHGCGERARELVDELQRERHSERQRGIRGLGRQHDVPPVPQIPRFARDDFTFACAIWKDPWMWCGSDTYVASLVTEVGGRNVVTETRYPSIDVARISADVIFLPDEPYLFTEEDAALAREKTGASVIGPFPGHLFTWHGTRTILGLRFLSGLRPE